MSVNFECLVYMFEWIPSLNYVSNSVSGSVDLLEEDIDILMKG